MYECIKLIAPAPSPVNARATNSFKGVAEKPLPELPVAIIESAAMRETLRPNIFDSLPLIDWMLVLGTRKLEPTREMDTPMSSADAMAGRLVEMAVWSRKDMNCVRASAAKIAKRRF